MTSLLPLAHLELTDMGLLFLAFALGAAGGAYVTRTLERARQKDGAASSVSAE